ncbi:hypothetical protein HDV06_002623, partial [Boothiomyces sp. JEL0866]
MSIYLIYHFYISKQDHLAFYCTIVALQLPSILYTIGIDPIMLIFQLLTCIWLLWFMKGYYGSKWWYFGSCAVFIIGIWTDLLVWVLAVFLMSFEPQEIKLVVGPVVLDEESVDHALVILAYDSDLYHIHEERKLWRIEKLAQQKLEALEQRKLELRQKQNKQDISSDEQVELEELIDDIAEFKQKEGKWMDIIESATRKRTKLEESYTNQLNSFLSNTLGEIEKGIEIKSGTGTERSKPRTPRSISRWNAFKPEAARFNYPTTTVGKDVLPFTTGIQIKSEKDVDRVVGNHLDNFNRVFRDQGKDYRFNTKVEVNLDDPTQKGIKFIGSPGFVLTLGPKVLSFIEDKTPNTLPVKHPRSGDYFDLVQMYKEDMKQKKSDRNRGNVGRMEVLTVINQVYGYLAFNNLLYGCVTCYD